MLHLQIQCSCWERFWGKFTVWCVFPVILFKSGIHCSFWSHHLHATCQLCKECMSISMSHKRRLNVLVSNEMSWEASANPKKWQILPFRLLHAESNIFVSNDKCFHQRKGKCESGYSKSDFGWFYLAEYWLLSTCRVYTSGLPHTASKPRMEDQWELVKSLKSWWSLGTWKKKGIY